MKLNKNWKVSAVLFLLSQNTSLFGSSIVGYAVIWHITLETSSGFWMMLATIFSNLPQIIISLWGGALADRFNRKYMIMLADGFIALATLGLAISYWTGFQDKILLLIVLAIRSTGAGIQSPAVNAIYPQIVPKENLIKIQGINQTINAVCLLLAPAIGGVLLGSIGLVWAFMVDVVTAIIAITIMSIIKVERQNTAVNTNSMISDIRAGIGYVFEHSELKKLIVFYAIAFILLTPAMVLSPLMVERTFGNEVWRLTANEIIWTIGSFIGGVFIAFRKQIKNKAFAIAVCFVAFGVAFGFMSIATNFVIYLILILVAGFFMPILTTAQTVYVQEITEPNVLGRVFSILQIASTSALPIAILFLGPLADIISIQSMLFVSGILLVICGALYGKLKK
ncbi:MFS transporter [Enterocloster aldensis]|uniref:MFS transporter n=1 Tax=Enterocloster aldenensis TaxID=358742 RepID=A0ABX2HK07_9FIRM|nr:MFS transporter [Enterocloster aldenensis]